MTRDFERGLREWGARPARTRPEAAATRVLARLQSNPRMFSRRPLLAAAAVTLVVLIATGWLATRNGETTVAAVHTQPLDENVVLWWVDPETPVYFVLAPPNRK